MGRCIGLDVHRDFAQVAVWEKGRVTDAGRIATSPEGLREYAKTLRRSDKVALEATMNTSAIAGLLAERAGQVVVSNPFKTKAIAEAKIKTDKVDARVLAELLAADYLPSVWQADEVTRALRRQVGTHVGLVRQRTRIKNQVQAILARNLCPRCPRPTCSGTKAAVGWRSSSSPMTSVGWWRRCYASWTSLARSSASWMPISPEWRWMIPTSAG